ncbi:hypothetical protein [Clostridium tarantellae]|nr:hypothetical protein [Clostridium tarantellae]
MSKKKTLKSINQGMEDNSNNSLKSNNGYQGVGNSGKQKSVENKN